MNSKYEKEIEEIKQNFQKLKAENDVCLKQKDEKIKSLEEDIKKVKNFNYYIWIRARRKFSFRLS